MRNSYDTKDYSIGVIPYCQTKLDIRYLLIHHTKGHRAFPKGHAEEREKMQQTALRELYEETGVNEVTL
jgi:bis(5'-nucleosidyl)-tetraphosphatase